jgi:hypothetical protein
MAVAVGAAYVLGVAHAFVPGRRRQSAGSTALDSVLDRALAAHHGYGPADSDTSSALGFGPGRASARSGLGRPWAMRGFGRSARPFRPWGR